MQDGMKQSRRDILRAGAGLASAGALSGLAGCGALPFGGGGSPLGGGAYYSNWLVAPDAIDRDDYYSFQGAKPATMEGDSEFSDSDAFDTFEDGTEGSSSFGPTGIDFESIDQMVSYADGSVQVAAGSFTVEDVADELDDNDYDEESELDSGERVFLDGESGKAFAVSSEHIIGTFNTTSPTGETGDGPSQPTNGSGQENVSSISYGQTVTSTLSDSDTTTIAYDTHEEVTFQGSAGEVVAMQTATADNSNDVSLYLEDPDGEVVAEQYSYGDDIMQQTLESSGEYTIIVGTYDASYEDVTYSLSLTLVYSPDQLVEMAETVAGVQNGNTESYSSSVEAASPLFDALGGGVYVYGDTFEQADGDDPENGTLEDSVAQGLSFSLGDGEINVTGAVVYDSESDVDTDDVEDWADEGTLLANESIDDISTSTNGRVATFSGVADYDDLYTYNG